MRWQVALLSLIAALALPVVGLVTGRVVGDFFLRGDLIGAVGAAFGVLVYALALASSYSHLRHYYRGYEAQGVRASWALALAVEVATFYMSFAYVVIHSPWAFWGSLIGAFVVFWGNFSSMYEARVQTATLRASSSVASFPGDSRVVDKAPAASEEPVVQAQPFRAAVDPVQERSQYEAILETLLSAEAVETKISQVRQSVRAVQTATVPQKARSEPLSEIPTRTEERQQEPTLLLSEGDKEVLRLAAEGPIGPSGISRALGIAKSSAGDRLKKLERMGLLVKRGSSYVPTSHAQASIEGGQALYQGAQAPH
ncbi:winged helix-turn-helix domain-containing protein [Meiothermus ruber]|uniref:Iron dependent repressor n=1 Tax=Meiothermus ruber (strain ATCC 35948 / DSM 1279 / VKM B-1258 / 21) TaxID=504728 RepID=D3PNG7_MEIRD|nr:transcriptional regulator [Meiothermus ruber]ADD27358.1 iron dependent repressor [Meiothermus ruber DSM 1279]AGK03819.1 iron dependent repressor [Meiothermus ruber DSM 1279]